VNQIEKATALAPVPHVAVIILNWNGYVVSSRCLKSLATATYPSRTVYLVDNGSTDGSAKQLQAEFEAPGTVFIQTGANLGFAGGCNRGIARALADGAAYLLLLNNDCVVHEPGFLEQGVATAEADPRIGIVGGKIVRWPDTQRIWCTGGRIGWWRERYLGMGEADSGQYDEPGSREFISGALMLIRRAVIEDLGLLPEEYFFGHEDWEFSVRTARRYRLQYSPRFSVAHEAGSSHQAVSPFYLYNDTLGKLLFKKRNMSPLQYRLWISLYTAYLVGLFPIKYRMQRNLYLAGVNSAVLRQTMLTALRDSRGLTSITRETLDQFSRNLR
jgi:GT2 family glycosyltransferase